MDEEEEEEAGGNDRHSWNIYCVSDTVLSTLHLLSINDESRKILEQESGGIRIIIYED